MLDFDIIRNTIPINSVDVSIMLNDSIGFIKINRFSAKTTDEFNKSAEKLLNSGMQKLIIDLRDNPGGYLSAAVNICDKLLNKGELIVYTQGRMRDKNEIFSRIVLFCVQNSTSGSALALVFGIAVSYTHLTLPTILLV